MEYVRLTLRELALGKIALLDDADGIGAIFPVPKSGDRQRAVWHGTLVSEGALRPVKPRRLADPSAFLAVDWARGTTVRWSKRDAASFFDTFLCPEELTPWFGRPAIAARDLCRVGQLALSDLDQWRPRRVDARPLQEDSLLYPCSRVWPMGFSWSSTVAQDVSLGLLRHAGFSEEQVLCAAAPPPLDQSECIFVLTDDSIFAHVTHAPSGFESIAPDEVQTRVEQLDRSMRDNGVQRKLEKDVTDATELTGMGCHLTGSPPRAEPDANSVKRAVLAAWGLDECTQAAPAAVASLLGVAQWFALLRRPFFGVFRNIYRFTRLEPQDVSADLPIAVSNELCLFTALAPLLGADLARDYAPHILASDAAPEFGFGVSVASASTDDPCELGRLSERRGDFVRLEREGDPDAEAERPRLGRAHRVTLRRCDFRHVLSVRAREIEHSWVLELNAALLLLRWLSRAVRHHFRRHLILLDAKAIIGALQKGRSSSRKLGRLLQRVGAYTLACDFAPRFLYVPTEDMPADAPSRGVRARPTRRRLLKKKGYSQVERRYHNLIRRYERTADLLDSMDSLDSGSSSSATSSS